MARVNLFTYKDAIDHLIDFVGANVSNEAKRDAQRAILSAYREFAAVRRWTYYYTLGRLVTVAPYSTGTIAYTHTGGTYERMVTLSSGTWPTWASYGVLLVDDVAYQVVDRKSSTVITLSVNSNPGANVASGTTYKIYRDTYTMPADFLSADELVASGSSVARPCYVHPRDWLIPQQLLKNTGTPSRYTFTSSPDLMNAMAVRFQPAPDAAYNFDYIYHRRPRQLLVADYKTGTVTASSGSTTLTGASTVWESKHVGSVVRLSSSTTLDPTGLVGSNPFVVERVITAFGSATSVTVDSSFSDNYSGVKYNISDPVDVEEGAMLTAFLRCCEKQNAITRLMKSSKGIAETYREALVYAMEADNRTFATRGAGMSAWRPSLSDYPGGADE